MQKGTGHFSRAKFPSEFHFSSAFFDPHPIVGLGANRPIVARTRTGQNGNPLYACRTKHGSEGLTASRSSLGGIRAWTYTLRRVC